MSAWVVIAFASWTFAGLMTGLWWGERGRRIYVENLQMYGTPNALKKAKVSHPADPEDRIEAAIDEVVSKNGTRIRIVRPEDSPPQFDPQTVQNGVEWLLAEARARGEQLSEEDAKDEVIRMLGAEGAEI